MKINWCWCVGLSLLAVLFSFSSCRNKQATSLFTKLSAEQSGISFSNEINDNDSSVSFINEFGYMGGGVGIGDFNNDGLKDIFFSGNQVSSALYINEVENKFKDISAQAGIKTDTWCTGVSIVDINNDGFDDIYVCVLGKDLRERAKNLLFINQQNLTFKESAERYHLADSGFSTQAAFFDYDLDGDLDMYLANYLLSANNSNAIFPRDNSGSSPANDRLYRNDGDSAHAGHPVFTDVTIQAGIKDDGYGLGLSVSDLNSDGWPDVYVGNDFISNDFFWLNNRNGTFTNTVARSMKHQSYSSMGTDAADINNDALPDLITLDMLPEDNARRKTSVSFMNYERYQAERAMGYEPEFVRNMLQLNNGVQKIGDTAVPFFSEIGKLSGIHATDWSWSVLMADFNNDGWKDVHITNGIGRDFINGDFLEFSNTVFNSSLTRKEQENAIRKRLAAQKNVNLSNYLYINNRDLSFSDQSAAGGIDELSMSNGAAYADIDNDGDLDMIVNNINKEAFVFVNNSREQKDTAAHFLRIQLNGDSLNRRGFGAKIFVHSGSLVQLQEQQPVRGYFSSVDQQLLFGLGTTTAVDSVVVIWPDNKTEVKKNLAADTLLTLKWAEARSSIPKPEDKSATLFSDITVRSGISYRHNDNNFNDFTFQKLLPQKYSQLGPFIATGDINNDGLADFFIGNGFNFSGQLFAQQKNSSFQAKSLTDSIKMEEDMDCLFFDADKDGDNDLLITSGDVQFEERSPYYRPRLYFNNGMGAFTLKPDAFNDSIATIAGTVSAGDYDGDGDLDVFIGGRVSKSYPLPPRSYVLQNNKGIFTDVTQSVCAALIKPGMITSSVWTDFDNDKEVDLVIAGEWMPVKFFKNQGGKLTDVTAATGLNQMNGMWRSLIQNDIDNDGDIDFIAGNLGLNSDYRVSDTEPMEVYAADIDGNGVLDPVLFYYIKGEDGKRHSYPAISRGQFAEQVPAIKKRFLLYKDYSTATADDIFKGKARESLIRLHCNETRSCYFENLGNGKFVKHVLPVEAQFSPVNAILCDDFDGDGLKDILLAGNEYQTDVITGRYDASYGSFLRGGKNNTFNFVPPMQSGFILHGDVKSLSTIQLGDGKKLILAAVNNDLLRVFEAKAK
jgi:hypothetical protein